MSADIKALVADNIEVWSAATERKKSAGRGSSKKINLYGLERLRALILELAVRGNLTPQKPTDPPASELLAQLKYVPVKTPKDLPLGWEYAPLSAFGEFVGGLTPSKSKGAYWGGDIPWVSPKDMGLDLIEQSEDNITKNALEETTLRLVPSGSLLMVARSGILRRKFPVAITSIECATNQDMKSLVLKPQADVRYLQVMLQGFQTKIVTELVKQGMTVQSLIFNDFKKALWPIPPLAEQKRVVAKVDELMALCDELERESEEALTAHQTLVEALLGTLTASIDAADLAKNWARLETHFDTLFTTEASIDALKQTILELAIRGKFSANSNADWQSEPLGKYVAEASAGWSPKCIETPRGDDKWGVLKVSAVTWGEFRSGENKELPASLEPRPKIEVKPGDFLISRANTADLVARSVVVPIDAPEKLMMSDKIIRFRFDDRIDPAYVNLANAAPFAREYYARVAGGTSSSMKNVSQAQIRALEFPFPPLPEQRRLVAKVNELFGVCMHLKIGLRNASDTQRLLADAFTQKTAN